MGHPLARSDTKHLCKCGKHSLVYCREWGRKKGIGDFPKEQDCVFFKKKGGGGKMTLKDEIVKPSEEPNKAVSMRMVRFKFNGFLPCYIASAAHMAAKNALVNIIGPDMPKSEFQQALLLNKR